MGSTVSPKKAKQNRLLGVEIDKFQKLVIKRVNRKIICFDYQRRKSIISCKIFKILAVRRKSHRLGETPGK